MSNEPIEGSVLIHAAAKASVAPDRLVATIDRVQAALAHCRADYRNGYERVHADDDREIYLVESGHWADLGDKLDLGRREVDGVRRAHTEQLRRVGRQSDRASEFETALEIREPVVVGRSDEGDG